MSLSPLVVLWLGVIGLVVHVLLGALQSGSFNSILATYSLPPINVKVFPWLGLLLGLAGGVVMGMQAGDAPLVALAKAITAMVTGGASALHLETVRGALPANTPGAMGSLQVVAVQRNPVPMVPPAPVQTRMAHVTGAAFVMLLVACVFGSAGCGAGEIFGPGSTVLADLEADAKCLTDQVLAGNLNPSADFAACKIQETQTIDDLWNVVVDDLAGKQQITPAQQATAKGSMAAHLAASK